jgi:hypothetical protein
MPCFFIPFKMSAPVLLIKIGPSVVIVPFFVLALPSESVFVVPFVNEIVVVFAPEILNAAPFGLVSVKFANTKLTFLSVVIVKLPFVVDPKTLYSRLSMPEVAATTTVPAVAVIVTPRVE